MAVTMPRWKVEFLTGSCPSCKRSTVLALFFNADEMPAGGAIRIRPVCVTCGYSWSLPDVTPESLERAPLGMLREKHPTPNPPPQPDIDIG